MPAVRVTTFPPATAPHSGGRGTDHKLPTGGGGGDDWKNQPPPGRGPRERLKRARVALAYLMVTSLGLFVTVCSFYLLQRGSLTFDRLSHTYVNNWHPIVLPPLLWWNTAVILLSSAALEIARRAHFREEDVIEEWLGLARPTLRRALPWEVAGFLLAVAFVAGQAFGWWKLYSQGIFLQNGPSTQFYYFLTALHGIHLVAGMLVLVCVMAAALISRSVENRQIAIDITTWYWHAITVVWLGVFAVLHLCTY